MKMDDLVVVTHAEPVTVEARPIEHEAVPDDRIALGFFVEDNLVARGVVQPAVLDPLGRILSRPVTLALAAAEDAGHNIEARLCIVLTMPDEAGEEAGAEPWRSSVPDVPAGIDSAADRDAAPRLVLLPLGNVVRAAANRRHEDVASEAREMLDNLLAGRGQDAVSRAIDDLLRSI